MTHRPDAVVRRLLPLAITALLVASAASAHSRVRVDDDQTTIWRAGFAVTADVVPANTILDVVGKTGNWYEVRLPHASQSEPGTGFVAVSRVTALDRQPIRSAGAASRAGQPRTPASRGGRSGAPAVTLRLFTQTGFGRTNANRALTAVVGQSGGMWWGGGVQLRTGKRLIFDVAADRFARSGHRLFVFDDELFDLGVREHVDIVPVTLSVGSRFAERGARVAYAMAGAGRAFYRETSPDATDAENARRSFATYQAKAGLEFGVWKPLKVAVEAQYSRTPISVPGGVAQTFGEHDLGGVQARVKFLLGR